LQRRLLLGRWLRLQLCLLLLLHLHGLLLWLLWSCCCRVGGAKRQHNPAWLHDILLWPLLLLLLLWCLLL
jgi:hypothetical protein